MSHLERRAFLRKLAKGAVYSAPVVYSMAAPVDLIGQGMSSGKGKGKGNGKGNGGGTTQFVPPPPGSRPPGG